MTELSPAAEAVLNAVTLKRYDVPYYACPASINHIKSDVAAALRAAANNCESGELALTCIHSIHAIADELEAQ